MSWGQPGVGEEIGGSSWGVCTEMGPQGGTMTPELQGTCRRKSAGVKC